MFCLVSENISIDSVAIFDVRKKAQQPFFKKKNLPIRFCILQCQMHSKAIPELYFHVASCLECLSHDIKNKTEKINTMIGEMHVSWFKVKSLICLDIFSKTEN